ncbi:sulfotransferase family 2 domain-containing protein [uncultured Cohaesibacter sp.]|uniref:sulfotransferase family 2 domain-containing protein n=1 Tax=uncultured Cohaesibacter sp. TaxID=1002546 RepID=UPI0029C93E97|nr:sulfotransferase family 2 domain-containing protein [uncultured Cohaesibacter sp.]
MLEQILNKFHRNQTKIVFIHLPKTGGEAIATALTSIGEENKNQILLPEEMKLPKHQTLSEFQNSHNPKGKWVALAVVRNPYDRLVSFYYHLKRWQYDPRYNNSLPRPQIAAAFASYYDFKDWCSFVLKPDFPSLEASRKVAPIDHFKPMNDYLIAKDSFKTQLEIIRFENLEADFGEFCNKFDIKAHPLVKVNASRREPQESFMSMYDDATLELVSSHYRVDFDRFGYDIDLPS